GMPSSARPPVVERARPLLGTYVAIRVSGAPDRVAHRAIEAAFGEIAVVHHRMSFHEVGSDVSRINRGAVGNPIRVHPHTWMVLTWAQRIAEASCGWFDVTVARRLVEWGLLPRPQHARDPDPRASWRDIELSGDDRVLLRRPVWIDLGGIAKGYAVDCATERLQALGITQACVNAGGDLRVFGPSPERVHLRRALPARAAVPIVEIEEGSVASSGAPLDERPRREVRGAHVDAIRRRPLRASGFACVIAERCVVADALTKVVLARRERSEE